MIARRLILPLVLALPLAACNVWQRQAEFAPPQSRWPSTLPGAVAANAPPPPVQPVYCYRSLAQVDCFATPQPERASSLTGIYPAN
jgi:hypothetical protein